jgi:hypothetical protein
MVSEAAPRRRASRFPSVRIDPLRRVVVGLPPVGLGHASFDLRVESLS